MGPYIERCVPFQIMSNQLNLPQADSNQVVDQWKQDAHVLNFMSHSKGSEYLCKYIYTHICKNHYGVVVCKLMRGKKVFKSILDKVVMYQNVEKVKGSEYFSNALYAHVQNYNI